MQETLAKCLILSVSSFPDGPLTFSEGDKLDFKNIIRNP